MNRAKIAKRTPHWWAIAGAAVALALSASGCGGTGDDAPLGVAGGNTMPARSTEALTAATCPIAHGSDLMTVAVSLVEELLWTEGVFTRADPGSPAQFRARESADELRYRLETLVGRRCRTKQAGSEPSVP